MLTKNHKAYKEKRQYGPFKGTKKVQENLSRKREDTLDKDLRIIVLKMLKKLKENVEKVKKTKYQQNKNVNKEKTEKKQKRNSGNEQYKN